jgi:putative endonuclease
VPLGRSGEELAERFLVGRGHVVLARRFRVRHGEIDLVTRSGEHLYFVEVKTRRSASFGGGLGALDRRKVRRMARVADVFIGRRRLDALVPHLSLVTVEPHGKSAAMHFLPDAFDAA